MAFIKSRTTYGTPMPNPVPPTSAADVTTEYASQSQSDGKPSPVKKSTIKKNPACSGGK